MPNDLEASLNSGEKEVLTLLAAGHTIKTAAAKLGLTENAVNERLRSARRKTRASSSRELARELYPVEPQISCDKVPVVPSTLRSDNNDERRLPIPGRWLTNKGILAMTCIAILASALIAFTQIPLDTNISRADDLLPPLAASGLEIREKLESEPSDPAWARAAQIELSKRFSKREGVDFAAVRCRTSLCEVNAFVRPANQGAAMRAIGDNGSLESLSDTGISQIETIDMRFVNGEEKGTITVFLARGD